MLCNDDAQTSGDVFERVAQPHEQRPCVAARTRSPTDGHSATKVRERVVVLAVHAECSFMESEEDSSEVAGRHGGRIGSAAVTSAGVASCRRPRTQARERLSGGRRDDWTPPPQSMQARHSKPLGRSPHYEARRSAECVPDPAVRIREKCSGPRPSRSLPSVLAPRGIKGGAPELQSVEASDSPRRTHESTASKGEVAISPSAGA